MPRPGLLRVLALLIFCALLSRARAGGQTPDAPAPQRTGAQPDTPAPLQCALPQAPPAAPVAAQSATPPAPFTGSGLPASRATRTEGGGSERHRARPQQGGLSFSLWDRSPLDAIARGERTRSGRTSNSDEVPEGFDALNPGTSGLGSGQQDAGFAMPGMAGGMGNDRMGKGGGGMSGKMGGARGYAPGEFNPSQLTRADAGMRVRSSLGSLNLSYQNALGARGYQGGSVGMGAAHATFTSTPFAGGLFDFSSSLNFGSGTSLISNHSGLSAGYLNGSGVGAGASGPGIGVAGKKPASSVSVKLSF